MSYSRQVLDRHLRTIFQHSQEVTQFSYPVQDKIACLYKFAGKTKTGKDSRCQLTQFVYTQRIGGEAIDANHLLQQIEEFR